MISSLSALPPSPQLEMFGQCLSVYPILGQPILSERGLTGSHFELLHDALFDSSISMQYLMYNVLGKGSYQSLVSPYYK